MLRTVHAQEFEGIPYFLPKRVPLRPVISGRQNLIVDDRALAGHCPVVLAVTGSNTSTNEFVGTEDARNAIQYAAKYLTEMDEEENNVIEAARGMVDRIARDERRRMTGAPAGVAFAAAAAAERPTENRNENAAAAQRGAGIELRRLVNIMLGSQPLAAYSSI